VKKARKIMALERERVDQLLEAKKQQLVAGAGDDAEAQLQQSSGGSVEVVRVLERARSICKGELFGRELCRGRGTRHSLTVASD
jgi:hypothetical protein